MYVGANGIVKEESRKRGKQKKERERSRRHKIRDATVFCLVPLLLIH